MTTTYGSIAAKLRDVESDETIEEIRDVETDPTVGRTFNANRALSVLFIGLISALLIAAFDGFGYDVNGIISNFALIHAPSKPESKPSTVVKATFYKDPAVNYVSTQFISVTATNEYGQFTAPYAWMKDVEGTQLVEPYKDTTLTLSGDMVNSGLYTFFWSLTDYPGQFEQGAPVQTVLYTLPFLHIFSINELIYTFLPFN
jgi:hypothetical protein